MADGWHLCPSASSARDILPAVVCSVIVAPAWAAPDLPGMTATTATWMAPGARPVNDSLSYWRKAHSATRGIGCNTGTAASIRLVSWGVARKTLSASAAASRCAGMPVPRQPGYAEHLSNWRRRHHQTRSRWHHRRTRLARDAEISLAG